VIYGGAYRNNTLCAVDTATGALTAIGTGNIEYVDFGSTDTGLYGLGRDENLYSIDPKTGAATLIGPTHIPFDGVLGMSSGGGLFVTHNNDRTR
jgi:hypothetical protein